MALSSENIGSNGCGSGIDDGGKQLEIFGANEQTILMYDGNTTTLRDGAAISITNSNSIVRNLTYIYNTKNSGTSYNKSIFKRCLGTISNVFFRISGTYNASYLYYNDQGASTANIISNCTFFHDLGSVSSNYSGYAKWSNIATNVDVKGGTATNTQVVSFATATDSLSTLIDASKTNETFNSNEAGVYYGTYAWE